MAATPPATSPATPSGALHEQLYPLPRVRQPQAVTTVTMLPISSDYNSVMQKPQITFFFGNEKHKDSAGYSQNLL
jgi:hypothetical protein